MSVNDRAHKTGPTSELDISSEPTPPSASTRQAKPVAKTTRVLFTCCRVYARVPVPAKVLTGELSAWRLHCPRCGQLIEIPN